MGQRAARLALALLVALAAVLGVYRPLHLRWGATNAEVARVMPGDDVEPWPVFNANSGSHDQRSSRANLALDRADRVWQGRLVRPGLAR